jgi:cell division protein FtsQ
VSETFALRGRFSGDNNPDDNFEENIEADADGGAPAGHSRRRLILIAALITVCAVTAGYVVAFSPLLGARTVTVRGAQGALAEQVRGVAAVRSGTPLIRLDTAAVARRVERIAAISSAQVATAYPSTVTITVSRRVPVGVVHDGSSYLLVDRTGLQYERVTKRPQALPQFVVPAGTSARTTGGAVATVAAALPKRLRARIAMIQALDPTAITLVLSNRRVVRWGAATRSGAKARVLPALLHQQGSYIDVTDPDRPFNR